jgi:outer membrane protein OmpA-like peptidoglycan-associated protein
MNRYAAVPLLVILAGCASGPPTPVLPDGSAKQPVNDPDAVRAFLLSRQLADSQRQLDSAKAEISRLRAGTEAAGPIQPGPAVYVAQGRVVPAPARSQDGVPAAVASTTAPPVYRVVFPFASAAFDPPAELVNGLLPAALQADRVELRGRTDSHVKDDADARIALARALAARRFLVARGVPPAKIRVTYLSSGDFIADDSTPEGRAQNRRVDIVLSH